MSITRRSVLQAALVAAASLVMGRSHETAVPPTALLVYDSRLPLSRALNNRHLGHSIDLAVEHATLWRKLRDLRSGGAVVGLTSWSHYVHVRALLGEHGWRLSAEARRDRLFYWEMA
jgi:hypothetical protein